MSAILGAGAGAVAGSLVPALSTTATGAEGESFSVEATALAQFMTLIRNIVNYVLEYMRQFIIWAGEHPLATTLLVTNFAIWIL